VLIGIVLDFASSAITGTEGDSIKVCLNLVSGSILQGYIIQVTSRLEGENGKRCVKIRLTIPVYFSYGPVSKL